MGHGAKGIETVNREPEFGIKKAAVDIRCFLNITDLRNAKEGRLFLFLNCFLDYYITGCGSWDCSFDKKNIRIAPHVDHLQILYSYSAVAHMTRHLLALHDPSRRHILSDGTAMSEIFMCAV